MHIKVPFLAILFISIFQLAVYGVENNSHSKKDFEEVLIVDQGNVSEIEMVDFSGQVYSTKDSEHIKAILDYFDQYEYKRLVNDETSYMPKKTRMITVHAEDKTDFLIPYGNEIIISQKVYSVKNGKIEQDDILKILDSLQSDEKVDFLD